jgi:hypothetical protein
VGTTRPTAPHRRPPAPPPEEGSGGRGRHRSPWGRSGRILPIRWGRIVAGCLAAVAVAASVVAVTLVVGRGGASPTERVNVTDRQPGGTSGLAVSSPAPGDTTAGTTGDSASPAPGVTPPLVGLQSVPPPPTGAPPTETLAGASVPPRAAGPVLALGATTVDFGSVDATDSVTLSNVGTQAVTVRIGTLPSWLTAVAGTTTIDPGYQTDLVLTLDRASAPIGQLDVQIPVTAVAGSGGGTITVTGVVTGGPRILTVTPPSLAAGSCATTARAAATATPATTTGAFTAQVQDPVGMAGGSITVTASDGTTTTLELTLIAASGDQSSWTVTLGPLPAGVATYAVTVKDLNNRTVSQSGSLTVAACA